MKVHMPNTNTGKCACLQCVHLGLHAYLPMLATLRDLKHNNLTILTCSKMSMPRNTAEYQHPYETVRVHRPMFNSAAVCDGYHSVFMAAAHSSSTWSTSTECARILRPSMRCQTSVQVADQVNFIAQFLTDMPQLSTLLRNYVSGDIWIRISSYTQVFVVEYQSIF